MNAFKNTLSGIVLAVFSSFSLLYGCSLSDADISTGKYRVKNVIDGDTIELMSGEKVRYIGIDTPEITSKADGKWIFDPEPFASEAKEFNEKLIGNGFISLRLDEDTTDRYGRILAYVYNEKGRMINAELIKQGLASIYTFYPNVIQLDMFVDLQKEAIGAGRGMWAGIKIIPVREVSGGMGTTAKIMGVVSGTSVSNGYLILEFRENGDLLLKAEIPLRNMPVFNKKGIDPFNFYLHRNIIVTGKMNYERIPTVYVDNPSQITFVDNAY